MADHIVQTKCCCTCRITKPLSSFHRNKGARDGLQKFCKDCARISNKRYHSTERARKRALERFHRFKKTRMGIIKIKARSAVTNAILAGRLPRAKTLSCKSCGQVAAGYHHYLGYAKRNRLKVMPLCRVCHKEADRSELPREHPGAGSLPAWTTRIHTTKSLFTTRCVSYTVGTGGGVLPLAIASRA